MRRTLLLLVIAAISCGGKPKPATTPLPPEAKTEPEEKPDDKPTEKPEAKPDEAATPPAPTGPVDATIEAPKMTVKLVSAGKGKKAPLKLTPKVGTKQQIEVAMDFSEHQSAPKDLGGDSDNSVPTVVLIGDSEVKAVDPAGKADYVITVTSTDVRDATGKLGTDELGKLKAAVASLEGMTMSGSIDATGAQSDIKLHVEKPKPETQAVLELVRVAMPILPPLPAEPVAVGAKWEVTRATKVMDKVDVTHTTDFELKDHKGTVWTIAGTTKVSGSDQDVAGAKLSKITGKGNVDVALTDGVLYPKLGQSVETGFQVEATGQGPDGKPVSATLQFGFKQGAQITPK
jgi:hypothetical protein